MYDNNPSSASEADKGMMMSSSSSSSCLGRAAVPVKRVWRGLSSRVVGRRRRRTTTYVPVTSPGHDAEEADDELGVLGRLRTDVRTCEYHDVHVMWEMLGGGGGGVIGVTAGDDDMAGTGKGITPPAPKTRKRRGRKKHDAPWSRLVAYCCGAF
ncbi:hypothetical protein PR202_gb12009 [Eleusine coracana subsp. coracana]|uniref:Uncharacterized protein n=1 Tax=Eleusine coracana subsp. coracana TaxID=191504 RepID=A0AAV5ENY9_ELECO|nr:hypothetical protein QOZ80_7BG0583940 [Eleusine coracana subsp. coracana]GJN24276.1 hypothetical protein PR202_gb12009 [Eleusine coracana subsp. coracana]